MKPAVLKTIKHNFIHGQFIRLNIFLHLMCDSCQEFHLPSWCSLSSLVGSKLRPTSQSFAIPAFRAYLAVCGVDPALQWSLETEIFSHYDFSAPFAAQSIAQKTARPKPLPLVIYPRFIKVYLDSKNKRQRSVTNVSPFTDEMYEDGTLKKSYRLNFLPGWLVWLPPLPH